MFNIIEMVIRIILVYKFNFETFHEFEESYFYFIELKIEFVKN